MRRRVRDSRATMRSARLKCLNEEKVKRRWSSNSTYRLRYWNELKRFISTSWRASCNSTYRLWYAPQSVRQQKSEVTMRSTHCLPEWSEGKTKAISNSTHCLRYETLCCLESYSRILLRCNSPYRLRYWNFNTSPLNTFRKFAKLQQHLPFTVCVEGCETAEEQSDDEVRTSQVPERREGKTKMMKQ